MSRQAKYPPELRERAIRMVYEQREHHESQFRYSCDEFELLLSSGLRPILHVTVTKRPVFFVNIKETDEDVLNAQTKLR